MSELSLLGAFPMLRNATLRDWFAGQAMASLLAGYQGESASQLAARAYVYADAMMRERRHEPEPQAA